MALSQITKIKVRDHLRYGIAGLYRISPAGGTVASGLIGYRFFQAYGTLEYRMNNMDPVEEAMLTGFAVGSVGFVGGLPRPGDIFTLTISGPQLTTPTVLTVTAQPGNQGADIANAFAALIVNNLALQQAEFTAGSSYGSGPFGQGVVIPLPELSIQNPQAFTLVGSTTSALGMLITSQGNLNAYAASIDGTTTLYGFIPILDALKGALFSTSQNLDTMQADVWKGRSSEMALRQQLYEKTRAELGNFMGLPVDKGVNSVRRTNLVNYR